MPWTSLHVENWLVDTGEQLKTADNRMISVWEFRHCDDDEILSAWAKHFRNHYCSDSDIELLREGTKYSRSEYLGALVFPDFKLPPGPSIRAGDFGEILVADYLEYLLNFWVPRTRYDAKAVRNESTKGTDIIGFHFVADGQFSPQDVLALFEAKTQFSSSKNSPRLQDAIDDSAKDYHVRKSESLNAMKRRFLEKGQSDNASKVSRFQNVADNPYKELYGAVALFEIEYFDQHRESSAIAANHPNSSDLKLVIIKGKEMMRLVHELYRRAADEA